MMGWKIQPLGWLLLAVLVVLVLAYALRWWRFPPGNQQGGPNKRRETH